MRNAHQKKATRKKILASARKLFFKKGYHQTKTVEIAANADVSEGSVFNHFGNKENILLALVEEVDTEQITQMFTDMYAQNSQKALTDFLLKHKAFIQKNSDLLAILLYESRFNTNLQKLFIENVASKIIQPLENLITSKVYEGEFKELDPSIAARAFLGMFMPFVAWREIFNAEQHGYKQFDHITVIEELVNLFLTGTKNY